MILWLNTVKFVMGFLNMRNNSYRQRILSAYEINYFFLYTRFMFYFCAYYAISIVFKVDITQVCG